MRVRLQAGKKSIHNVETYLRCCSPKTVRIPEPEAIAHAKNLIRAGALRIEILRATGLTADQISELIDIERPKQAPTPGRCTKTGDLFG